MSRISCGSGPLGPILGRLTSPRVSGVRTRRTGLGRGGHDNRHVEGLANSGVSDHAVPEEGSIKVTGQVEEALLEIDDQQELLQISGSVPGFRFSGFMFLPRHSCLVSRRGLLGRVSAVDIILKGTSPCLTVGCSHAAQGQGRENGRQEGKVHSRFEPESVRLGG